MSFSEPVALPGSGPILAATRQLLRPLVKLLIRRGVTFPVIADLLRGLYVDVASADLLPDARTRTDSRLSLMTGVHRKEIRRLRAREQADPVEPGVVTVTTQVIARWLALSSLDDLRPATTSPPAPMPQALPPALPRSAEPGAPSFEALVAAVTTDIRPRAVLEEWVDQGLVHLDDNDHVHLNVAAFLPDPGGDEQAFFLGRNMHDHLAAGTANVLTEDRPPFLDRSAHYDQVSPETARRIEDAAREIATRALQDINGLAMQMIEAGERGTQAWDESARSHRDVAGSAARRHGPGANATARVNFGVYVYREETPPPV